MGGGGVSVGVSSAHDQVGIHEPFQKCELSYLMKVTQWPV